MELAKSFEPHAIEAKWYPLWEVARLLQAVDAAGRAAVLHPASAAERHRHAAHGPRVPADADGPADPLSPDARRQHAVAGRHRPRRHRDADRRRAAARRRRARRGTTSAASSSSNAYGRGRRSRVRRSRNRCAGSARRPTGRASASRWTPGFRLRCSRPSCGCTTTASSIAASASSTGIPTLGTAVSDLEVESEEEQGKLWQIRYPLADGGGSTSSSRRRGPRRCWATSRSR